jgi:hypothetical protein
MLKAHKVRMNFELKQGEGTRTWSIPLCVHLTNDNIHEFQCFVNSINEQIHIINEFNAHEYNNLSMQNINRKLS